MFCENPNIYKDGIYKIWVGNKAIIYVYKPEYVQIVLSNFYNINKSYIYDLFKSWLGNGLITAESSKWSRDRKMISPAFHFSILDNFVVVIIEKTQIMLNRIEKQWMKNPERAINIYPLLSDLGLDVICETAMGVNIEAQENTNIGYSSHLKIVTSGIMYRVGRPWLLYDWIFAMTRVGKQYFKSIEYIHCFGREIIKKRKEARRFKSKNDKKTNDCDIDIKERKAFLDLLLDINEKDSNPLSDEDLREHVDTFMFAGHDTTSLAITWTLLCLGNELEIQEKVYQEIKDVMEKCDGSIDIQTISQLKYLERICKETHRLIPSVCTFSRTVMEDIMIDKYVVPKGAMLAVHVHGLHHNPTVWTNPEKFDPDRFLIEQSQNRNPYAYVPFSAGPRNCIGQKFANLEQKLILAMLLQKWIVKSSLSQEDVQKYMAVTVQPLNGLYLYFTPRK